jgi:hypothetical protein
MPKNLYCSRCKKKLTAKPTAITSENRIVTYIDPHECEETIETSPEPEIETEEILEPSFEVPDPPNLDEMFKGFEHIENAAPKPPIPEGSDEPGDRRPDSQVKSTAPSGVLSQIKNGVPLARGLSPKDIKDFEGGN